MAVQVTRLSSSVRSIIVNLHKEKLSSVQIQRELERRHQTKRTRQSIRLFLIRYKKNGLIGQNSKRIISKKRVLDIHRQAIHIWLTENSELTSKALCEKLEDIFQLQVTTSYMCKLRKQLGWTTIRVQYCQLISHINKLKRKHWCLRALHMSDSFSDVIFVDETTVELSSTGRIHYFKRESEMQYISSKRPKPKHSYKVHVWGGISYRGATDICIFSGIMDSLGYQRILDQNFLPFTATRFSNGYRLYQDNDSKHKSKSTKQWMSNKNMLDNVMETPASSPDLNPIENLWSSLKQYLQSKVKPKTKETLISGIRQFWDALTVEQCIKYIDHIHKVIPVVILNDGAPSGY